MYCKNCGEQLNDEQSVCLKCGVPSGKGNSYCPNCGTQVSELAVMCVNCGKMLKEEEVPAPTTDTPVEVAPKKSKKKILIPIIAGLVVVIGVIIVIALAGGSDGGSGSSPIASKDFNDMFSDVADESWCEIGYDGTWMQIDTNPYDIEDSFNSSAWYKIKSVLTQLGFPSSVAEEMNQTRALDGRQTASHGRYEVTWTYHPDDGLEVMFKIVD